MLASWSGTSTMASGASSRVASSSQPRGAAGNRRNSVARPARRSTGARARHDQHIALAYPRIALVVAVVAQALGDDGWRFMALQQLQDGAELLADRRRLFVGNRAQGMVGETNRGRGSPVPGRRWPAPAGSAG